MTALQLDPSAHAPWTSTMFGCPLIAVPPSIRGWSRDGPFRRPRSLESSDCFVARPLERRPQLRTRRDPELRENAVEVGADRAVGEEQPLADLTVRQPLGGQFRDLQLLGGEPIACVRGAWPDLLAGGTQLLSRALAPACRAQGVEEVNRVAQRP